MVIDLILCAEFIAILTIQPHLPRLPLHTAPNLHLLLPAVVSETDAYLLHAFHAAQQVARQGGKKKGATELG